jgi:hypothetical protein
MCSRSTNTTTTSSSSSSSSLFFFFFYHIYISYQGRHILASALRPLRLADPAGT